MRSLYFILGLALLPALASTAFPQNLHAVRDAQLDRLRQYVLDAILPSGLVRDSLVLDPNGSSFHPATPDAAGFALLALSALDHLGKLHDAEGRVVDVLSAYAGHSPGVAPARSADGHFVHFMNVNTGTPAGGGWDQSYSPISTALLVAGAQFARNHFTHNSTIASLTQELTETVDFNAAIHPSLDGRIFADMTRQGGGAGDGIRPWNEFMLVESLALREDENDRALAVKHLWLELENLPTRSFGGIRTLTDNPNVFAPAFWVQQSHFFNGDFRHNAEFEAMFTSQQLADQIYSRRVLNEDFRYGLTAGVAPDGYNVGRILDHPFTVFSPEAVAAWGDLETMLAFHNEQQPDTDPRYRYGLVRVSAQQPGWVPSDAGLVDHLFLLFGLVESLEPTFFADRVFPGLKPGDYNQNGVVEQADLDLVLLNWGRELFNPHGVGWINDTPDGVVDQGELDKVLLNWGNTVTAVGATGVPEPSARALALGATLAVVLGRRYRRTRVAVA